ncbi:chromosome segregation protein Spc25-domain-containing protein [Gigaspora rosea]|uniref:Kinetochore protein SPC25 n=1 Tax=Gigaspora rosea TaxID=44941 RepID=A0A397VUB9_9GLOM|nr:chromosome segregation protein Spc25-domain-containing protein [Gigaspora rosea]
MYSVPTTPVRTPSNKKITGISFTEINFNYEDINNYADIVKKSLTLKKQQWQNNLASEKSNIARHNEEIKSFEKKQKSLIATLDKEKKEIHKLQAEVSNLKVEENTVNERKNFLVMQIDAMKKEIQKQRDSIVAKQLSLEAQLSKNEPELKRFVDRLAFTMEGARDDAITFTFTCIYENDSSQPCSFTLNVVPIYTVLECNPPLDQIEELVSQLNTSRDFYTFVKRIRLAFRELARAAPKSTGQPQPPQ